MKWIGAFLLIMATTCLGIWISNHFEKRPQHIRLLETALQLLEAEITYSQAPLPLAFSAISQQLPYPMSQFFDNLSTAIQTREKDLPSLWNEQVEELTHLASFKKAEMEILRQFGTTLGQHDFIQQQKQIRLALTHLNRELEEAREEHYKYSKLIKSLGMLTGVFIALILI